MPEDLDDIPDFLRLSPEQRRAAWERNPPKAVVSGPQPTDAIREQLKAEKKAKAYTRIAKLKEKQALDAIPKSQRRWDATRNKWVQE
jgi:hypothetical protein